MASIVYPLPKFHFQVQAGNVSITFSEVSGLAKDMDIIEYRVGSSPEFGKIKMPGLRKFGNITLKRGVWVGQAGQFDEWFNTVSMNLVERRNMTISLLDENHAPMVVWKVKDCFVANIKFTDMKADANELAIDTMEIANQGFTVEYL